MYLALIVAYVGVLKYMAEKPEEALATEPTGSPSLAAAGSRA